MARLLLVDDDPDILEALTLTLEEDHQVETARDGWEALERLVEGGIELVVLDLMMPRMSGMELVQALRARRIDVPIIVISAMHDRAERAVALGAADSLDKPFRLRALRAAVDRVLAEREPITSTRPRVGDDARARLVRVQRCSRPPGRGTRAPCPTKNEQASSEVRRVRRSRS